jgi:hypothetical protein
MRIDVSKRRRICPKKNLHLSHVVAVGESQLTRLDLHEVLHPTTVKLASSSIIPHRHRRFASDLHVCSRPVQGLGW